MTYLLTRQLIYLLMRQLIYLLARQLIYLLKRQLIYLLHADEVPRPSRTQTPVGFRGLRAHGPGRQLIYLLYILGN